MAKTLCREMPKPTFGDMDKIRIELKLSQNLYKATLKKANELGMPYHAFVETALLSANTGSVAWRLATERKQAVAKKSSKVRQVNTELNRLKKAHAESLEPRTQIIHQRKFKQLSKLESKEEIAAFIADNNLKLNVKIPDYE
jgi:hypothetical protein